MTDAVRAPVLSITPPYTTYLLSPFSVTGWAPALRAYLPHAWWWVWTGDAIITGYCALIQHAVPPPVLGLRTRSTPDVTCRDTHNIYTSPYYALTSSPRKNARRVSLWRTSPAPQQPCSCWYANCCKILLRWRYATTTTTAVSCSPLTRQAKYAPRTSPGTPSPVPHHQRRTYGACPGATCA